ncbi:MAG TPA: ABC transporter permease [Terriglobia bacterium]|nr:ABC transporter permease [Terriglobia bacterium]
MIDELWQDLRYGLRLSRLNWRYVTMVVLTLAVCVGANTAVFTVVHSVLLQPLPVPGADDIVLMSNQYPKAGATDSGWSAGADYYDRMHVVTALQDLAMFNFRSQTVESSGVAEQLTGMAVTPSLLRLLRVAPNLGRSFTDDEGEVGGEKKVILSHALWYRLYAGDCRVLGRELRLGGHPYTIVGVMPPSFLFINPEVRFWVPLALTPEEKAGRHSNNWHNIGRLKPGATLEQVQAQVDALNAANLDRFPQWREILINAGFRTTVSPLKDLLVKDVKATLYMLWAGAGFVLLIGVLNIAGIAVARIHGRTKELGTRFALGAGLGRVARQLMVESILVTLAGGLAGLGLSAILVRAVAVVGLDRFPRAEEVRIDVPVLSFTLGVSICAGALIALLSVAYISRLNLRDVLHDSGRTSSSGVGSRILRKSLVVVQVGFAFVLLTSAGLLLASFRELLKADPGFATSGVLTASMTVPTSKYPGSPELRSLVDRSLDAIRRIPGVTSAGATTGIPFASNYNDSVIIAEGYVMKPGESLIAPLILDVTPGYFETMGVRLVRGRYFDERDREGSQPSVIVDERLANRFWPNQDPIGKRVCQPSGPDFTKTDEHTEWLSVVGVVRPVRLQNLAGTGNPVGAYYFPFAQKAPRNYTLAIMTSEATTGIAQAVRTAMAGVDPTLALFDVKTMAERTELSISSRKDAMSLAVGFGVVALFLSGVGIYGVLSYLLAQRRREIGIRIALGSTRTRIFRLFLREGIILVSIGVVLGLAGAAAMRRALENQIYGVHPLEPVILFAAGVLLATVALSACLWPARQATRVDPVIALNE